MVILVCSLAFVACQPRNKLNSDEQKLAAQIKTEEQAKLDGVVLNQNQPVVSDTLPSGFRFQEDRSVDPENPPEVIDIAGNIGNNKAIKFSDIGTKVRYIRLAPAPDSLFTYRRPTIQFTKSNIIATSQLATCVYSLSGEFIDIICKSELKEGLGRTPPTPKIPYFSKFHNIPKQFKGTRNSFSGIQNKGVAEIYDNNYSGEAIYFKFRDREEEKSYLMKYDVAKESKSLLLPGDSESKNLITSKGENIASLSEKSTFKYHILDENSKIGHQSKWNSTRNGIMLLLENMKGDTLCIFSEPERITNYDATVVRSVESGSKYFYENQFTYRSAFNDTVFRLIPPNRLLPVFVLNFGKHKTTALEAIHPKYNLDNKFIINSWVETHKNIFIRYTENRTSINSLKNKTVKFYYACYFKNARELNHLPVDPLNYVYEIENDIDGGLSLWPKQINQEGKFYKSFEGWELKRHVKSDLFKQSNVPQERKEKLIQLAKAAGDAETIILIIE